MVAISWEGGKVRFLDQTLLPMVERFVLTDDYHVVGEAIRALQIRGAPAIGVAAAFGCALAVLDSRLCTLPDGQAALAAAKTFLSQTRPTAVNLFAALERIGRAAFGSSVQTLQELREAVVQEARAIQEEDIAACLSLGRFGASLIEEGSAVLTHCNTGALATAGEGTALSAIVEAHRQGKLTRVYVDETRPLLQGARLTAWELKKHGIETVLIIDSAAASVLRAGWVKGVFVGADRIAANGDVANKVGTYPLAVLAARHGVPFYVVAPTSTVDLERTDGSGIPIEERPSREVTHWGDASVAPEGVCTFCPAFDVTPNDLLSAIVTEKGILRRPYGLSLREVCMRPGGRR
jgi:methylthioribose-1-phosphate isomerase